MCPPEVTGGGTAVCCREGDEDELYQPPYINMPGNGGHWEFYNDRSHAEKYFEEKHPDIAQFRKKLYDREVHFMLHVIQLHQYLLIVLHNITLLDRHKLTNSFRHRFI